MTAPLDIRGSGTSYAILRAGRVVARASSHGNAIARLAGIERAIAARPIACLSCGAEFLSAGRSNRLCPPCRKGVDHGEG